MIFAESEMKREIVLTLRMDEATAERLAALMYASVNWTRNPWARALCVSLEEAGLDVTDTVCDEVRHEIELHIESTQDDTREDVDDVMVLDEDDLDE